MSFSAAKKFPAECKVMRLDLDKIPSQKYLTLKQIIIIVDIQTSIYLQQNLCVGFFYSPDCLYIL